MLEICKPTRIKPLRGHNEVLSSDLRTGIFCAAVRMRSITHKPNSKLNVAASCRRETVITCSCAKLSSPHPISLVMAHPFMWPNKVFFYPIGNTPPVCLTQGLPPEEDASVLLLGCGDPRSILYSLHSSIKLPNSEFDNNVTIFNDRNLC
jgi:hypothetical protein